MKNIKTKPLHTILIILLCLLTSLSVSADFQKGVEASQRGDYATALREWKPLAEQGDASAQYNLGLMYDSGEGVPEDDKEAAKWYRRAAEQEDADAQTNLALMYGKGKGVPQDYVLAYMWINLAAAQNSKYEKVRNILEKEMTPSQLEKVQRLSRECLRKNYKGC